MKKLTYIYYLHLGDNKPFYIGKSVNPNSRKHNHRNRSKNCNILLEIIDEVPTDEWLFWERHYISLFKSWGFILQNKNEGGGGSIECSDKKRNIISLKNKQKNFGENKERSEKISKALKGRKTYWMEGTRSEDIRKKMSESKKGKKHNWGDKISNGKTKHPPVLQYDLEENFIQEFKNIRLAGEWVLKEQKDLNINNIKCGIRDTCNGRQKTAYGYKWGFKLLEK